MFSDDECIFLVSDFIITWRTNKMNQNTQNKAKYATKKLKSSWIAMIFQNFLDPFRHAFHKFCTVILCFLSSKLFWWLFEVDLLGDGQPFFPSFEPDSSQRRWDHLVNWRAIRKRGRPDCANQYLCKYSNSKIFISSIVWIATIDISIASLLPCQNNTLLKILLSNLKIKAFRNPWIKEECHFPRIFMVGLIFWPRW